MFKIGEFARLSQLSVKTLRYYDRVGLFQPAHTDRFTSYRYYSADQLPRLNRILVLKELGFSLEQISGLLDEALPIEQMRGMLRLRRAEQEQRVQEEQARLTQIEARLQQLEERAMPMYEVVVKRVEAHTVASLRGGVQSYPEVGRLLDAVWDYVERHGVQGQFDAAIWHDPLPELGDIDVEGVVFIAQAIPANERIRVYELPGHEAVASLIHHGSYFTLPQAYPALARWLEASDYTIVGPNRELYLHGGSVQDDPSFVTELQFPVERATPNTRRTT